MPEILREAIEKDLAPVLEPVWDSITFWRTATLLMLAALAMGWVFRVRLRDFLLRASRITHDTDVFQRSDTIMSESALARCMTHLWNASEYRRDEMKPLREFSVFFKQAGNQYLSRRLSRTLGGLTEALDDLLAFTALNFFVAEGPSVDRLLLYPELRTSHDVEERATYQRSADELAIKVKRLEEQYRGYRLTFKRCLLK